MAAGPDSFLNFMPERENTCTIFQRICELSRPIQGLHGIKNVISSLRFSRLDGSMVLLLCGGIFSLVSIDRLIVGMVWSEN